MAVSSKDLRCKRITQPLNLNKYFRFNYQIIKYSSLQIIVEDDVVYETVLIGF